MRTRRHPRASRAIRRGYLRRCHGDHDGEGDWEVAHGRYQSISGGSHKRHRAERRSLSAPQEESPAPSRPRASPLGSAVVDCSRRYPSPTRRRHSRYHRSIRGHALSETPSPKACRSISREALVHAIVVNLAHSSLSPPPTGRLAILAGNPAKGAGRYDNPAFGKGVRPLINQMHEMGLLDFRLPVAMRGEVSIIAPTAEFALKGPGARHHAGRLRPHDERRGSSRADAQCRHKGR